MRPMNDLETTLPTYMEDTNAVKGPVNGQKTLGQEYRFALYEKSTYIVSVSMEHVLPHYIVPTTLLH